MSLNKCKYTENNSVVHEISSFCTKTQSSCNGYDDTCPLRIDNFPDVKNKIIYQAAQAIRDYYLAKLPANKLSFSINGKKKNSRFNKGVEQYNQAIAEMRRAIKES